MKLYNLGKVPWHESQIIYHALAALGREALLEFTLKSNYFRLSEDRMLKD